MTTLPPAKRAIAGLTPAASPEEAAALSAAIQQFLAETTSGAAPAPTVDRWQRAALLEGVQRDPRADLWGGGA